MQYHQRSAANTPQGKRKRVFTPREEEPASPQYTGHYAGLHSEDTPHITTADVQAHLRPAYEPDEYEAGENIRSIARRYTGIPMPDGVLYRQGNEQIYVHNGPPPIQRASKGKPRTTEEIPVVAKKQRRFHWLYFVGIVFLIMIVGYGALNAFSAWWQVHSDDSTYGRPRTYQTDAVVGHGDSPEHPSHFIALNLNRHTIIIEIPGGDVSKSVIYTGPTLMGEGQDLTPVTLTFSDVNGDGKVDMLLHILDQTIVFLNNGSKFVPPSNTITDRGSNPPVLGGVSCTRKKYALCISI